MSFREMRELGVDLKSESSRMQDDLLEVVTRHSAVASAAAAEDAPRFTGGGAGSIKPRGAMIEGAGGRIHVRDIIKTGRVSMVVHETGRGIGKKSPPHRVLLRWVRLMVRRGKLKIQPGQSQDQLAFLIGRAIKSRGQIAQGFMDAAARGVEPEFQADVERVVSQFRDRLYRG